MIKEKEPGVLIVKQNELYFIILSFIFFLLVVSFPFFFVYIKMQIVLPWKYFLNIFIVLLFIIINSLYSLYKWRSLKVVLDKNQNSFYYSITSIKGKKSIKYSLNEIKEIIFTNKIKVGFMDFIKKDINEKIEFKLSDGSNLIIMYEITSKYKGHLKLYDKSKKIADFLNKPFKEVIIKN